MTPIGEVPTKILKIATGADSKLYEDHARFCEAFRRLNETDGNLVSLMQVLCLFNPDRQPLSGRQAIWSTHDRFTLLLKRYIEAKHGFAQSRELYASVLSTLADLQRLTQDHGQMLIHVDPSKVDPLILEVFDLGFIHETPHV